MASIEELIDFLLKLWYNIYRKYEKGDIFMNGYEIVDDLMKRGREFVREDALYWAANESIDAEVAVMLLTRKYNGQYVSSKVDSSHSGYVFENPKYADDYKEKV